MLSLVSFDFLNRVSLYITQAGLEVTMWPRLAWNLWQPFCLTKLRLQVRVTTPIKNNGDSKVNQVDSVGSQSHPVCLGPLLPMNE